jgi:hypothetical protein
MNGVSIGEHIVVPSSVAALHAEPDGGCAIVLKCGTCFHVEDRPADVSKLLWPGPTHRVIERAAVDLGAVGGELLRTVKCLDTGDTWTTSTHPVDVARMFAMTLSLMSSIDVERAIAANYVREDAEQAATLFAALASKEEAQSAGQS